MQSTAHAATCSKRGSTLDNRCPRCRYLFRMLHVLTSTPRG